MYRITSLTFLGLVLSAAMAMAQSPVPRPVPAPTPRPAPTPTVRQDPPAQPPRPPMSKRQIEERRGDTSGTGTSSTPTPSPAPGPLPAGPGAPGPVAPALPAAEVEAAEKRVEIWRRSLRPAHREHWVGSLTFLDDHRKGRKLDLEIHVARNADGKLQVRFRHGRLGDLPEARALRLLDDADKPQWWRFRPEEGREARRDDGLGGPIAGLLDDLVPIEPSTDRELRYIGAGLLDARRVLYFRSGSKLVSFRPDLNLVVRVESLDGAGKALRELRFEHDERRGLHRRFTSVTRHDFETGESLRIDWEQPTINDELPADFFSPASLARAAETKATEDAAPEGEAKR